MTESRRIAAAVVFAALAGLPLAAYAGSSHSNATVSINEVSVHIDNFGRVAPGYFRGGQPEGPDYADLASLGVKTVINLTSDDSEANEKAMTEQAGMSYVQIPMTTHQPPTSDQLAEFLGIVTDPIRQPVYVHCVGGRHRTGIMTAAYRMTQDRWTADQAFREMKHFHFGADFLHSEFKDFVYGYRPAPPSPEARATRS